MNQLQEPKVRPLRAQLLDCPAAYPATAMCGHTGWLVDDQQRVVLQQRMRRQPRHRRPGGRCRTSVPSGGPHRWQAYPVTGLESVRRVDSATVHPHLPGAEQTVKMALGHALEDAD